MRILHAVTLVSPDGAYGGPLRVALNQAQSLRARGHSVTLAAGSRGHAVKPVSLEGVPLILRSAMHVAPRSGFAGLSAPNLLSWLVRSRREFDVAHVHFARDLVLVPLTALIRQLRIPYVLQPHGMIQPRSNVLAPAFDRAAVRRLLCNAHEVFYLTDAERDALDSVSKGGARLTRLLNGVPLYEEATREEETPEVLFLARLHPRKRAVDFVEAALEVSRRGLPARFAVVGPDEGDGPRVAAVAASAPNVHIEGSIAVGTGPERMRRASVYVLPSVDEPYPMAVLEAMSVGIPVIVTSECGLAPVVRKYDCGLVIEPGAENIAAAVTTLLESPTTRHDMGRRGRDAVRSDLGMTPVGTLLEQTYADAAEGRVPA